LVEASLERSAGARGGQCCSIPVPSKLMCNKACRMALWGGKNWGQQPFEICAGYRGTLLLKHIGYGVVPCWCDGEQGGRKEWSIFRISRRKKRSLALLVHGHLFSGFYTRQGSQPLLAALARQRVDENILGLHHQPINRARCPTKNAFT
jgi:hypothetical protein